MFLSPDNELIVWDVYNAFDPMDQLVSAQPRQKYGKSELQLCQSVEGQPIPVIPTHLQQLHPIDPSGSLPKLIVGYI